MNILSLNYNYNQPSFNAWNREVFKNSSIKELKHRNDTNFFRDTNFWYKLVRLIKEKYKNIPDVNVYCYGCSNGLEPYTFIMELMTMLAPKEAEKFLPVIAKDYDSVAIRAAKNNKFLINTTEANNINLFTGNQFNKYFKTLRVVDKDDTCCLAKSILTDNVEFSTANILEDYTNIKPDNSIVFARNFWPYLSNPDRDLLAEALYNQLGNNSMLVIGRFDLSDKTSEYLPFLLSKKGFVSIDNKNMIYFKY